MPDSHSLSSANQDDETVGELRALIDRTQKALREIGREDLARVAHISVWPDQVMFSFREPSTGHDDDAFKALSIDPRWEATDG